MMLTILIHHDHGDGDNVDDDDGDDDAINQNIDCFWRPASNYNSESSEIQQMQF